MRKRRRRRSTSMASPRARRVVSKRSAIKRAWESRASSVPVKVNLPPVRMRLLQIVRSQKKRVVQALRSRRVNRRVSNLRRDLERTLSRYAAVPPQKQKLDPDRPRSRVDPYRLQNPKKMVMAKWDPCRQKKKRKAVLFELGIAGVKGSAPGPYKKHDKRRC